LKSKILTYWILIVAVLFNFSVVACRGGNKQTPAEKANSTSTLANPAAIKCVNDGFVLESVMKNGVPIDHICKNPKNGKKCKAWKYFRGECRLK